LVWRDLKLVLVLCTLTLFKRVSAVCLRRHMDYPKAASVTELLQAGDNMEACYHTPEISMA
jgi:hypothetical protein